MISVLKRQMFISEVFLLLSLFFSSLAALSVDLSLCNLFDSLWGSSYLSGPLLSCSSTVLSAQLQKPKIQHTGVEQDVSILTVQQRE